MREVFRGVHDPYQKEESMNDDCINAIEAAPTAEGGH